MSTKNIQKVYLKYINSFNKPKFDLKKFMW